MPNGDYGIFTPTEAAYKGPGDFDKAIRAEAQKRGAYLSSMDQFYAQLEVMEKQFGEKLAFEEKKLGAEEGRWEEELAWLKEQETGRLGLEREKLATQETLGAFGIKAAKAGRAPGPGEYPFWEKDMPGAKEEEITMDWLSKQLGSMYPTAGAKTVGTRTTEAKAGVGVGTTSYSTPGELPEEFYQTEEGTWRNF